MASTIWNRLGAGLSVRTGWIGVDIGVRAVKLVQLERKGRGVRIAAARVERLPAGPPPDDPAGFAANVASAVRAGLAGGGFRGRAAAAVLSLSRTPLRVLDLPDGTDAELRDMVAGELADDGPAVLFDYWRGEAVPEGGLAPVHVVTVSEPTARATAAALRAARLEPRTLDGLPLALARAADLDGRTATAMPRAVLDLGDAAATLAVVANGTPAFTRVLRGGGYRDWVRAIASEFELPEEETDDLLTDLAAAGPDLGGERSEFADLIRPALDGGREAVAAEVLRSLAYLAERRPDAAPTELLLLGGGATLPGTARFLQARTGLPTRGWRLPDGDGFPGASTIPAPLLGTAAALSALAWEP